MQISNKSTSLIFPINPIDLTVMGEVVDSNGNPLEYASVFYQGTQIGVNTDAEGRFVLPVNPKSTLVISNIGYGTVQIPPGSIIPKVITLNESTEELSEVVVYGEKNSTKLPWVIGGSVAALFLLGLLLTKPKKETIEL